MVNIAPQSDWGKFALGYAALWVLLVAGVDLGWGKLSSAMALLVAGSASVLYAPRALANVGLGGGPNAGS